MKSAAKSILQIYPDHRDLLVEFEAFGEFPNRTFFAQPHQKDLQKLQQIQKVVKNAFEERGIPSLSQFSKYFPHMTIVISIAFVLKPFSFKY